MKLEALGGVEGGVVCSDLGIQGQLCLEGGKQAKQGKEERGRPVGRLLQWSSKK